jgi:hypothetical protein
VTIIAVRTAYLPVLTLTLDWEPDHRIQRAENPGPAIRLRTVMQAVEYQNQLNEPIAYVLCGRIEVDRGIGYFEKFTSDGKHGLRLKV